MTSLFFSYSHKDEQLRNELETHLALLKRQGIITTWHDRRISAGSEIDQSISNELESAQVIVLLVSANFLASNYCYEKEMDRALERHKKRSAIVIPVILHPCDWNSAPFGSLRATPTDGKPVSMFANLHEAFSIITKDIREALEKIPSQPSATASNHQQALLAPKYSSYPRSSNLAIKKEFNDHERDEFLENSYEYIARFFGGSLEELEKRNPQIQARFKRIDETSFTASVYSNGRKVASCSIWYGNSMMGSPGICYSSDDHGRGNSMNETISVTDDGYSLKLKPMGMQSFGQDRDKDLSQQGAAEHLWGILIRPFQQ